MKNHSATWLAGSAIALLGAAIYLGAIGYSFAIHTNEYYLVLAATGNHASCAAGSSVATANQCINWRQPAAVSQAAYVTVALLAGYAGLLLWWFMRLTSRQKRRAMFAGGFITAAVLIIGAAINNSLLPNSQGGSIMGAASMTASGGWEITQRPEHGFGLGNQWSTITATYIGAYIIATTSGLYLQFADEKKYAGMSKETLFQ